MPIDVGGYTANSLVIDDMFGRSVTQSDLVLHLNAANHFSYTGSGSIVTDISKTGDNFATLNGSVSYQTNAGGEWNFDGSGDDYGSITNNSVLRPSTELTICMWLRANAFTSGWNRLFGQDPYTGGPLIFLETGGQLIRALHYPNGSEIRCNTDYSISTSAWIYAVFTFKMGDAIRSYFNGVASTTAALASGTFSYNTSNPYLFGHAGASWYNGKISTIRMYSRQLQPGEILADFNIERTRHGV